MKRRKRRNENVENVENFYQKISDWIGKWTNQAYISITSHSTRTQYVRYLCLYVFVFMHCHLMHILSVSHSTDVVWFIFIKIFSWSVFRASSIRFAFLRFQCTLLCCRPGWDIFLPFSAISSFMLHLWFRRMLDSLEFLYWMHILLYIK